jgi:hypothetical protein
VKSGRCNETEKDYENPQSKRKKKEGEGRRMFSVDLTSKDAIKNVSFDVSRKHDQGLFIEGSLGALRSASFQGDGLLLEIVGTEGVLRVDLRIDEFQSGNIGKQQKAGGIRQPFSQKRPEVLANPK